MQNQKHKVCGELVYIAATFLLAFSVAMMAAANLGLSMVVCPAYVLSQRVSFLTFGQSEYVVQSLLFLAFCLLMKHCRLVYFASFFTCLFYGAVLDFWRALIPMFNPNITEPGSMPLAVRIVFFALGMLGTATSVAMFFRSYLYPQVMDFFVKGVSVHFHKDRTKVKRLFDAGCFTVATAMTLIFFGKFVGIGIGTVVMTLFNGILIGKLGAVMDRHFEFVPLFPAFAKHFELD